MKRVVFDFSSITDYNIVVCGVGGTGSNLIPFLTQVVASDKSKNITITLADGDIVEEKNLKNQKFTQKDIGKPKAEVLAERYKRIYPDLDIYHYDRYITDVDTLVKLLFINQRTYTKYFPVLVGCVDNNATRQLFHRLFYNDVPADLIYIDSGNGTIEMSGQVVVGLKKGGKVILPPVGDVYPQIFDDNDDIQSEVGCSINNSEHPQNICTNVFSAVTIFSVLNTLLFFNKIYNHIYRFNAEEGTISSKSILKEKV
ncbi:ThiF family adenylyltransferase [Caldanaerobacter subterraneus]|uniref:Thiamine biosynthesis protein ThiF n=1 Tax=Caldanaerobacter subterraneus TaxID=911092 RepID=A0A7Y2L618_9THEO|nr:ThiF family adenylyltransferase [Caldanaerobacter subterraneus]NNG66424.1 thiamine biosynthesis protein ThiF [Caldanaerobacter subterraneus]